MSESEGGTSPNDSLPDPGLSAMTRIVPLAQECVENIENVYGDDASILSVMVVVEVLAQTGPDSFIDSIEFTSSETRRWVQLALLEQAVRKAEDLNDARIAEAEDALADED